MCLEPQTKGSNTSLVLIHMAHKYTIREIRTMRFRVSLHQKEELAVTFSQKTQVVGIFSCNDSGVFKTSLLGFDANATRLKDHSDCGKRVGAEETTEFYRTHMKGSGIGGFG